MESKQEIISIDGAVNSTHVRIMQAALELFASRGFHGTGIRDIASQAQVSTANLYHYTSSKDELLLQIMDQALSKLLFAAATIARENPEPRSRLEQLVRMHVITHALSPMASSVVDDQFNFLTGAARQHIIDQRDKYEQFYGEVIRAGVENEIFRVPDASAARLGLLEMVSGVARWYSPDGKMRPSEIADIHVVLALALLGVQQTEPTTSGLTVVELIEQTWQVKIH